MELQFVAALTGESLGAICISLPWKSDIAVLSEQLGQSMHGYIVMLDAISESPGGPSCGHLTEGQAGWRRLSEWTLALDSGLCKPFLSVPLVRPTQMRLKDRCRQENWPLYNKGLRRWNKEFREAAWEMPLVALRLPHYKSHRGFHTYGGADVRDLVPIVMQSVAADARLRRFAGAGRHRTWQGCRHALVRLTQLPLQQVSMFVTEWLQVHSEQMAELVAVVSKQIVYIE